MARASFGTLPLELKARIVKMTSDQEDAWRKRVEKLDEDERVGHINGLSSLALVNKELRQLAAKHQFKMLSSSRAMLPIFRFKIVNTYGTLFTELEFWKSDTKEASDLVFSFLGQLPGIRTICFTRSAAINLFGAGVTLRRDLEDEASSYRASILLELLAHKIETLILHYFRPSESVALVSAFPALKSLSLYEINVAKREGDWLDVATAIASLRSLGELTIEVDRKASSAWSNDAALAPLAGNPPPVERLHLYRIPLEQELQLVTIFSPTVTSLILEAKDMDPLSDVTSCKPIRLPRLTILKVISSRAHFQALLRILHLSSTLSHLSHYSQADDALSPTEPALVALLNIHTSLRALRLSDINLEDPDIDPPSTAFPSPAFLSAYANLVHSHDNLDPGVLDVPHLTPFHPESKLEYSENEAEFLKAALGRTLKFELDELERMFAEGSIARAVGWVEKLKALENERMAWKD